MKTKAQKLIALAAAFHTDSERVNDLFILAESTPTRIRPTALINASHKTVLVALAELIKIELEEELKEELKKEEKRGA